MRNRRLYKHDMLLCSKQGATNHLHRTTYRHVSGNKATFSVSYGSNYAYSSNLVW